MNFKKIFNVEELNHMDIKSCVQMVVFGFILLYAFTRFISPGGNKIAQGGLGLYLLYFLAKNPDQIRRDPMFMLFIGVIIAQVATWASVEMFQPDNLENKLAIDKLGKLFLFVPIAWGLKKNQKWISIVLLTAFTGFVAELFFGCDFFAQVASAIHGKRVDFGVRNEQHTSMVFGVVVIVSTFYMAVADKKVKKGVALLISLIGLAGMIATQTRQTFLGIVIAAVAVFIVSCFVSKSSLRKIIISLVMIGILTGAACYSITINHRQDGVWEAIKVFTDPLPENLKTAGEKEILAYYISKQKPSSGMRLKLWLAVLPYMPEHPLLGWGGSSIRTMIEKNPLLKDGGIGNIKHLHNFHITLYICYGTIGLLLINGVYVWLLVSSFRIRNQLTHGVEWFLLSVGFVTYWLVINCFENFNGFWTGVFCHNLIIGCIYSHYLEYKSHGHRGLNQPDKLCVDNERRLKY